MSQYDTGPRPSGWAVGGLTFASTMSCRDLIRLLAAARAFTTGSYRNS